MDRNAISHISTNPRWSLKSSVWIWTAIVCFLILPTILTHLFLWRLEHRLDLKIGSKPFFTLIPGTIAVKDVLQLEWANQLKVTSGSLKIQFPLSALVFPRFPLSMKGSGLTVEPGEALKSAIGQNKVYFEQFSAKLVIDSGRISEIEYLDAESKTIEFHLNQKNPRKSNAPHE